MRGKRKEGQEIIKSERSRREKRLSVGKTEGISGSTGSIRINRERVIRSEGGYE